MADGGWRMADGLWDRRRRSSLRHFVTASLRKYDSREANQAGREDGAKDQQDPRPHAEDGDGLDKPAVLLCELGDELGGRSQFLAQLGDLHFQRALRGEG